ncbi:cysteine desulfurase family protein [Nocardioides sp. T2.26MG-1]|uniref:cysteine desulfurase family protein n=1 Tax=Nocardioides sp. T2.26MG-1 TaxID=3041166 RepID=UPI0024776A8F|nr:aminotransferase class V-fold PLP-dependent enzyme [Nocardioides sp. T2.26MG-1]CAI9416356.1 Cysteine desulfurase NifS [Nocardioides sp. T2.26MG-1]
MSAEDVIYLDHNATTPLAPQVLAAMLPFLTEAHGNPSSPHAPGRRAAEAVAVAREQVAGLIGASPAEIFFTSGGTESNNLALRGSAAAASGDRRRIVTSTVEHPATVQPLAHLGSHGWTVTTVGVTSDGHLDLPAFHAALGADVGLVTVMLAQNETGAVMPLTKVAAAARAAGSIVHTDAAQAVGKIAVDVDELGVDLLSIAGHKLYAPKGIGALYVRTDTPLAPVLRGAGQEHGIRPGTENVAGIVGLGAASALARADLREEAARTAELRDQLELRLRAAVPTLARLTPRRGSLPNTLLVVFPHVAGWDLLEACPTLAAATGSACHSGVHRPSEAVLSMGLEPSAARGAVRLSLGRGTSEEHVEAAAAALLDAYHGLAARR